MKTRLRRRIARRSAAGKPRRHAAPGTAAARTEAKKGAQVEGGILIGGIQDPAEKAADRMAAQALEGEPVLASSASAPSVHRKCAECEAEDKEKEKAKRSAAPGAAIAPGRATAPAGAAASRAIRSLGAGDPLSTVSRAFFEPRFGRDLAGIRVHDGAAADRAATAIGARAFSYGRDIAFAKGEREKGGAPLMAHELAHVAQAEGQARRAVRRATLAASDGAGDYKAVPAVHHARVNAALELIDKALNARRCRDFFADNCTGGVATSARDTFNAATVYYLDDHSERFGLSDIRSVAADPHVVAYNDYAYDISHWEIASTLLHELFHTCDMVEDNLDEVLAETSTETCGFYSPWILEASPTQLDVGDTMSLRGFQFGLTQDSDHHIEMGGVDIASYDRWEFDRSASWVNVEFEVPEAVNTNFFWSKDVDLVAVNHGTRSNIKTINVDP